MQYLKNALWFVSGGLVVSLLWLPIYSLATIEAMKKMGCDFSKIPLN